MKGIRLIPDDTKIPFMRFSRYGYLVSGILCAASILLFAFVGLNMGVDFKGGTVVTIRTAEPANLDTLRSTINGLGLGAAELQEFGSPNDVLIRIGTQEGGDEAQQAAVNKIKEALGAGVEYRSVEVVGPKVSGELAQQGILAVVIALFLVLIYVWFRFEWQFALGAIASLMHDVILTIGLFCLLGLEFNLSIIAAILTIIGYSLNDTVVIYDRIREFLRKYKSMPFADLMDFSINSVLPRTLMTSVSVLLALLALYIWGGEVISGFTFTMIWGVIVGTYSSYFIATPILLLLGTPRDAQKAAAEAKAQAAARP
jgi:preprotein translocase SecF subunit